MPSPAFHEQSRGPLVNLDPLRPVDSALGFAMQTSKIRNGVIGLVVAASAIAAGVWGAWYAGLFGGLRSRDPSARVAAATSLAERNRDDPSVDAALIAALSDPSESVRVVVADTLGRRAARKAGKPLAALLADPIAAVRASAAWSLWKIPDLEPSAESLLRDAFSDPDPDVRRNVFLALEWLARSAPSADHPRVQQFEAVILAASKDRLPVVRRVAVLALGNPPKGSIVDPDPALIAQFRALEDTDDRVRMFALRGIPPLLETTRAKPSKDAMRSLAAKVPLLVDGVIEGDRDTRPVFLAALVAVGNAARATGFRADEPAAETCRAALAKALAVPAVQPLILVNLPVLDPLFSSGGKGKSFVEDQLRSALAAPALRPTAIDAVRSSLKLAGPADESTGKLAVALIGPALKDEKPKVRASAYMALWQSPLARKAGGDALRAELRAATVAYVADLAKPDPETRDVAAWCLAWTDREDAIAALAALAAARNDEQPLVKAQVENSITRLEAAKSTSGTWPEPTWDPFRRGRRGR